MPTDSKRREIAAKLRNLEIGAMGTCIPTGDLITDILVAIGYGDSDAMTPYGLLADLIEPPAQCPYYHSDRHRCSIHDVPTIDRDALLDVADKCDEIRTDGLEIGQYEVYRIVRRIRDALGVSK